MAMRRVRPAWNYLQDASVPTLESFELSRLNHAANLRREIAVLLDQWIEDTSQALLARWVRKERAAPQPVPGSRAEACTDPETCREMGRETCNDPLEAVPPFGELPPCRGESPRGAERVVKLAHRNNRTSSAC